VNPLTARPVAPVTVFSIVGGLVVVSALQSRGPVGLSESGYFRRMRRKTVSAATCETMENHRDPLPAMATHRRLKSPNKLASEAFPDR